MTETPRAGNDRRNTLRRRSVLVAAGAVAGGIAGCLDGGQVGGGEPVAAVAPVGEPVAAGGVRWADLGDLSGEVTVYSGRTSDQIDLVFDRLEETYPDLTVNRDYDGTDAQVTSLEQEGAATPADIFYSQDPGALGAVADMGLTQEIPADVIETIPESWRDPDGQWTGVSGRVRSVFYNEERLAETPFDSGANLPDAIDAYATDDRFEGIISTRPNSGTFRGFIQSMIDLTSEEHTREWVRGFMSQRPRLFASGTNQAVAVNRGGSTDPVVGLGNSYYAARILEENPEAPIRITFTEGDPGALFSVAGVAVTESADDPELVAEFVRHLLAVEGQEFMMEVNGEFPVIEGIDYLGPLPGPEELDAPDFDLSTFDTELQDARALLEDEGMLPV